MLIQSETMPPDEFIRRILERDARNIYRSQKLIVSERIYLSGKELKATQRAKGIGRRTGTLEDSVTNPDFIIQAQGETFNIVSNYPLYIRFLDMKHLGNWQIYSRQIWGILFRNALPDIKYRYGEYIADKVGNALQAAFDKYKQ